MIKPNSGFTLPEIVVTAALLGLTSLGVAKISKQMSFANSDVQNRIIMSFDAQKIMARLENDLKNTGGGLRGIDDPSLGKTLIALPDDPLSNSSEDIIFFSEDREPTGTMGVEDQWIKYSVALYENRRMVKKEVFYDDNWLDIKSGLTAPTETFYIRPESGVLIKSLNFILLDSQDPPFISNQDPNASSSVRVSIHLEKMASKAEHEKMIPFENMLYAPH